MGQDVKIEAFSEGQTHTENSWIIVDASTDEGVKVSFYSPEQDDESNRVANIKDLADLYVDEYFDSKLYKSSNREEIATDKKVSITASDTVEASDVDEDTRKSWTYNVGRAQIVDVYQSLALDKLPEVIKQTVKDMESMEQSAVETASDDEDFNQDPYAYHGVNKRDFL